MIELDRSLSSKELLEKVRVELNLTTPPNHYVFPFEAGDLKFALDEIIANCAYMAYAAGLIYLLSTFLMHKAMQSRADPFKLNYFAFAWNACLAVINAVAFCRLQPYAFRVLNEYGLRVAVCTDKYVRLIFPVWYRTRPLLPSPKFAF